MLKIKSFISFVFFLSTYASLAQGTQEYFKNVGIADSLLLTRNYIEAGKFYSKAFRLNNNKALVDHRYSAAKAFAMSNNSDSAFYNLFRISKLKTKYTIEFLNSDLHFNNLRNDIRWDSVIALTAKSNPKNNSYLSKILDSILFVDQKCRSDLFLIRDKYSINSIEYRNALNYMRKSDSSNLLIVLDIINKYGWLGDDVVGSNGNLALFLVIQHSSIEIQDKMLPILRKAVYDKRAKSNELALLEDRISVTKIGKQIYGSQYYEKDSLKILYPLIDPSNVNKRRNDVGLEPLENYLKTFNILMP